MTQSINGMELIIDTGGTIQTSLQRCNYDREFRRAYIHTRTQNPFLLSLSETKPMNYLAVALFMYAMAFALSVVDVVVISLQHSSTNVESVLYDAIRTYGYSGCFICVFIKHASD